MILALNGDAQPNCDLIDVRLYTAHCLEGLNIGACPCSYLAFIIGSSGLISSAWIVTNRRLILAIWLQEDQ